MRAGSRRLCSPILSGAACSSTGDDLRGELSSCTKMTSCTHQLEELAFVGGSTRSVGDLWLIDSDVALCCCDSDYAQCRRSQALNQFHTTRDAQIVELAGAHAITTAMGGISPDLTCSHSIKYTIRPRLPRSLRLLRSSRSTPSSYRRGCDTWRKDERWGTFGNRCDN